MPQTKPGEVWLVNLGLAAKVRPCLILSDEPQDDELALLVIFLMRRQYVAIAGNSTSPSPF